MGESSSGGDSDSGYSVTSVSDSYDLTSNGDRGYDGEFSEGRSGYEQLELSSEAYGLIHEMSGYLPDDSDRQLDRCGYVSNELAGARDTKKYGSLAEITESRKGLPLHLFVRDFRGNRQVAGSNSLLSKINLQKSNFCKLCGQGNCSCSSRRYN